MTTILALRVVTFETTEVNKQKKTRLKAKYTKKITPRQKINEKAKVAQKQKLQYANQTSITEKYDFPFQLNIKR